jgi:predicted nucleic acid-binding Zn ribbon protein
VRGRNRKSDDDVNRGGPPAKFGSVIDALLERWLPGFHIVCKEWEVVDRWHEIVIGRVAEVTECSGVENGVLQVKVASASWRNDLTYLKDDIKAAIWRVTGCDTIRDIMFY